MEVSEFSDTKVRRLIERVLLRPEDYVEVLGIERLEEFFEQYLYSRLRDGAPRKARYLGAGLLISMNFNCTKTGKPERLYGRKDLGLYLSQTGERVPLQVIDDEIKGYLAEAIGLTGFDVLPVEEQNELARRHIEVIKVDKTRIKIVPIEVN